MSARLSAFVAAAVLIVSGTACNRTPTDKNNPTAVKSAMISMPAAPAELSDIVLAKAIETGFDQGKKIVEKGGRQKQQETPKVITEAAPEAVTERKRQEDVLDKFPTSDLGRGLQMLKNKSGGKFKYVVSTDEDMEKNVITIIDTNIRQKAETNAMGTAFTDYLSFGISKYRGDFSYWNVNRTVKGECSAGAGGIEGTDTHSIPAILEMLGLQLVVEGTSPASLKANRPATNALDSCHDRLLLSIARYG